MADQIKSNRETANIATILISFLPKPANYLSLLFYIVSVGGNRIIEADQKNQSMTIVQEKKLLNKK